MATRFLLSGSGSLSWRKCTVYLIWIVLFLLLAVRLVHFAQKKREIFTELVSSRIKRADILDSQGFTLASDIPTFSISLRPARIIDKDNLAYRLYGVFPQISLSSWRAKLASSKPFIWIMRHITPEKRQQILELGEPCLEIHADHRRVYPYGRLFSHVVGFTDIDGRGLSGLERGLDERLHCHKKPLQLSLDRCLQDIIRESLDQAITLHGARGGNAILLDLRTNEILAMVALPDFDPQHFENASPEILFNPNTTGTYEFGSIFKLHTVAFALESGKTTLKAQHDATHPLKIDGFTIRDFRGKGRALTTEEAFLFSSNIAIAKIALKLGADLQQTYLRALGFFERLSSEIYENAQPQIPTQWRDTTTITISYGYGIAVTPLHLVHSVATLLTGKKRPITFLKTDPQHEKSSSFPQLFRLFSDKTVNILRNLLFQAVQTGQAKNAAVFGYEIGGKTGTANTRGQSGRYIERENRVSFIGAIPIHNPRYLLFVSLDRPRPSALTHGYATAGWTAAPLAATIFARLAPVVGIASKQDESKASLQ